MALDVLTLLPATPHAVVLESATVVDATRVSSSVADMMGAAATHVAPPVVDVPAGGLRFPFDWGPVLPGTDRVDVGPITIDVDYDGVPDFSGYVLGELATSVSDGQLVVTVPTGRRIRALTLGWLVSETVEFRTAQELRAADRRLTVSQRDPRGGWASPIVSMPPVDARGQIPQTLTGGTFDRGVLRLPDLTGPLKLAIVQGATPDEFGVRPLTAGTVVGWAAPTPVDLTLTGPDDTVLWRFVGPMPDGTRQSIDVSVPVSGAIEALRAAGAPVSGALTLTSALPCRVRFRVDPVRGDLIRDVAGTTSITLAGEPMPLPIDPPLPRATPGAVRADVAVTHAGLRLADISDPLPPLTAQHGVVVRQQPLLRLLPPLALRGEQVSRIGLVGFCPERCALLVRLVPAPLAPTSGEADPQTVSSGIGTPGTATVEPSTTVGVIWVDFPEPVRVDRAVAIEVSASRGSLNWVTAPHPLVRLVVVDPDPGGRPIVLGSGTLLSVDQPRLRTVRAALPAARFGGTAPVLGSALFCTVELTDIELRYPRGD